MTLLLPPMPPFPDLERAVADVLAGLGTTGSETGPGLQDTLPYIRVRRTGGGDDRFTDTGDVEVAVFAEDASTAKDVAGKAQQRLLAGPARTAHGLIDRARTVTGPQAIPPSDSSTLRLSVATYTVSARR